jgi:hypothetical protein
MKLIIPKLLFFFSFFHSVINYQIYDVLITEHFDNTTNITSSDGFKGSVTSGTCGNNNVFNVTSDADALNCIHFEPSNSVFACVDKQDAGTGISAVVSLEMLTYTAVDNDEIGFVGYFAAFDYNDLETTDLVELFYSIDNGATYTSFLVLTGNSSDNLSYSANGTGDGFSCSDGSAAVHTEFINKEFSIGSNLSGQTIKIKVEFTGFTAAAEGVVLDEFSLVKVRKILASEDFDNTSSLATSNGVFITPTEGGCNSSSLYDCTSNMTTPLNALNCLSGEDGDVFIMTGGAVASGEELEMLSYTATDNGEISFRGNFASFGTDQNTDNFIVVSYSTDNGATYTDAFTVTGIDGGSGTDWHSFSDGSSNIGSSFIKKGFVIGSNLSGSTIKIKVTYDTYTNSGDGIAIDKFRLEGSLAIVLPIELVKFEPKLKGNNVLIEWATLTEVNNDYFTIQRSIDATNFEDIDFVDGAGNSNRLLNYQFVDETDFSENLIYYRLKQTDFDGETSYSKIKSVNLNSLIQNKWSIYPNPVKEILNLEGDVVDIEFRNVLGEAIEINEREKSLIDLSEILNGTYFVKVWFEDGGVDVKKLIVNH